LNSPRSIEACKRKGIKPQELLFKSKEELRDPITEASIDKNILELRFQHAEKLRKEKMDLVVKERERVVEEEKEGKWAPSPSKSISGNPSASIMQNKSQFIPSNMMANPITRTQKLNNPDCVVCLFIFLSPHVGEFQITVKLR
jgi:hypothetical protein